MVEVLLEQGYEVEPGSEEVGIAYNYALSRHDEPLISFLSEKGLLGDLAESQCAN